MGKAKKKTLFLGVKPIGGSAVKSRRVARKVTTQYHTLIQQKNLVTADASLDQQDKQHQLDEIEAKLEDIGGINRYQEASVVSTKHFSTSKWIIQAMKRLRPSLTTSASNKLSALEVGAINTQLHAASFLNVRSIDLHSQHALIEEADFFDLPPCRAYDVIVCSMVINYVSTPSKRGEMVARLCMHLANEDGVLFLILPRRCVSSPFFSSEASLIHLLQWVYGLELLEEPHFTPRVAFFVLRLPAHPADQQNTSWEEAMRRRIEQNLKQAAPQLGRQAKVWKTMLQPESQEEQEGAAFDAGKTSADLFAISVPSTLLTKAARGTIAKALR